MKAAACALAVVSAVVVGSAGCKPPEPKAAGAHSGHRLSAEDAHRLVRYYARRASLPPNVEARVSDLQGTPVAGLWAGALETTAGHVPFTVTANGRYVLFAPLEDLSVDPYAEIMQRIALAGVPVRGPADATVTIVEYGDFQCPYSARAYDTLESRVLPQYGSRVRFAYKHLPLSLHPWAEPAAVAAECIKVQSTPAFWAVYAGLFQSQAAISTSNLKDAVAGFVADTGVDLVAFGDCYDRQQTLPVVRAQTQEALALGVQATPTFFVNGRRLAGAPPYEAFAAVIDTELAWQ